MSAKQYSVCLVDSTIMVLPQWNGTKPPRQVRHYTAWHSSALQLLHFPRLGSVDVFDCSVPLSHHIKVLGVTFDKDISSICKSAFYHIGALRHICSANASDTAVASSLLGCRRDYASSLLFDTFWHSHLFFITYIRRLLKTHCFNQAFSSPLVAHTSSSDSAFCRHCAQCTLKDFIYLLTYLLHVLLIICAFIICAFTVGE